MGTYNGMYYKAQEKTRPEWHNENQDGNRMLEH